MHSPFHLSEGPKILLVHCTMSKGELKYLRGNIAAHTVLAAGEIHPSLNLVKQGTTNIQRVGRNITVREISLRWVYNLPGVEKSASSPPNGLRPDIFRLIVYVDKQANGAAPAVLDIVDVADFTTMYNIQNESRFIFLLDEYWGLNYGQMTSETDDTFSVLFEVKAGDWTRKVNVPITFNDTAGVLTEVTSNNIGMLWFSQYQTIVVQIEHKIRYTDS